MGAGSSAGSWPACFLPSMLVGGFDHCRYESQTQLLSELTRSCLACVAQHLDLNIVCCAVVLLFQLQDCRGMTLQVWKERLLCTVYSLNSRLPTFFLYCL